ncbi:hypothetical protein [Pseudomonas amygdali]|uniref:Uncharacterized protein n=2 Tax=Pseudomonas amygdali pv. lachrymans TaxID=53707 RepID=A0ABR5KQZ9_PSEAV|nr:hypothetical protein [Pseudomonas amygdali]AXH59740.1 hypothetical protein PLA107_031450 [Pseudomonas amygdali pv. lachrymans str. M301315]KPC17162.1 Uncharacterized protein AC499_0364 [Pseudomonas amygdali pv. lachrymans]KPC18121.1 Uncharacterized protein AC499_1323 [Pseudomonas amygdali pv. lachrymans]RMT05828.1 hypothetical protein ALP54_03643 [Pseudomonas amygdali pv. lachrymans]
MYALKLAKAHLNQLEANRRPAADVESDMVKRADAILKGEPIVTPSVRMIVRADMPACQMSW